MDNSSLVEGRARIASITSRRLLCSRGIENHLRTETELQGLRFEQTSNCWRTIHHDDSTRQRAEIKQVVGKASSGLKRRLISSHGRAAGAAVTLSRSPL